MASASSLPPSSSLAILCKCFGRALDIPSSLALYSLTMAGGINGRKDAHQTTTAENEILIPLERGAAGLKERNGIRTITDSLRRFNIAADRVKAFQPAGAEHSVKYAFETLDKVGGNGTLWSIVFDTHDMKVYFRT